MVGDSHSGLSVGLEILQRHLSRGRVGELHRLPDRSPRPRPASKKPQKGLKAKRSMERYTDLGGEKNAPRFSGLRDPLCWVGEVTVSATVWHCFMRAVVPSIVLFWRRYFH